MKTKLILFTTFLMTLSNNVSAAQIFGNWAKDLSDEIKDNFFLVAAIIVAASLLANLGKLGEDRDWKGFFRSAGLYVAGIGIIVALFTYYSGQSL